ncbi:putative triosephosphate isomerase [Colletotrichum sidae]|uniref:Triosephosphate isomerase n=1 Tax=Colletotrichum sidae TaxID=1347389 RepID=A0A4R8T0X8_9PEZI|nr:putative triosephosphate isomerase [Colletotrichum sidae]
MATSPHKRLIGLSTKMYFSLQKTLDFTTAFKSHLGSLSAETLEKVDIFIIPDFVSLHPVNEMLKSSPVPIRLGAQDCHWDDSGAFTGEVSPSVLREAGVSIVEVGHAERRNMFGEDDGTVARKAAAASRNGMAPLVCVGEQGRGTLAGALGECRNQIDRALADVPASCEVIVAYEPVWAIGATEPAGEEHVVEVVRGIRAFESVGRRTGATRVIYGGSAGPGLFERLEGAVDGLFLGRFGHDAERFATTVREVAGSRT